MTASGCRFGGVPAPVPLDAALRQEALAAERPALPLSLAIAPIRMAPDLGAPLPGNPARHPAAPDPEVLRRDVLDALEAAGLFARVRPLGAPEATPEALAALAWEERHDLVLELEVRSYRQEYLGHTGYVPWFLVYVTWIWPAWYMPVDVYGVGLEVHARLRGLQNTDEPLLEATYRIQPEEVAQELTPSDRELAGFLDLGALWNVERSLEESNWQAIDRQAAPHARRSFALRLLRDLEREVAAPLRDEASPDRERLLRGLRKRLAVVLGVTAYGDPAVGSAPFAERDADAFAGFLGSPRGGGLGPRGLHLLRGEAATKAAALDAIAAVASDAKPEDEVLVYFAGFGGSVAPSSSASVASLGSAGAAAPPLHQAHDGAVAPDGDHVPGLLLYDARSLGDELEGALGLDELAAALRAVRARRVLLILDCSFGGLSDGPDPGSGGTQQGLRTTRVGARPLLAADAFQAVLCPTAALSEPLALLGARPEQAARGLLDPGSGLFTHVLLAGLKGAADGDGDGRVDLAELFGYTRAEVRSRAGFEGFDQEPWAIGLDPPAQDGPSTARARRSLPAWPR